MAPWRSALALVLLAAAGTISAQTLRYSISALQRDALGTDDEVTAYALNDSGEAVGIVYGDSSWRTYHWLADGSTIRLVTDVGDSPEGYAINDGGFAAGEVSQRVGIGQYRERAAVFLPSGQARVIAPKALKRDSVATGISNSGIVVGDVTGYDRAGNSGFIWSEASGWHNVGAPDGRKSRISFNAVNDAGLVVGFNTFFPLRALYYTMAEGLHWLPKQAQMAYAVNERSEIVGRTELDGFVYQPGGRLRLLPRPDGATQCFALDINNAGTIVGQCWSKSTPFAVVWYPSGDDYVGVDLNDVVDPPKRPAGMGTGISINDAGQILVSFAFYDGGGGQSAILTPLAAPR